MWTNNIIIYVNAIKFTNLLAINMLKAKITGLEAASWICPLQSSSSQKHMWPLPPPSVIQTWPTINRFISRLSVQVRRTVSNSETYKYCCWEREFFYIHLPKNFKPPSLLNFNKKIHSIFINEPILINISMNANIIKTYISMIFKI